MERRIQGRSLKPVGRPFKPGNPGKPIGTKNKFTTLKQSFLNVFQLMGGDAALLEFARTHKATFYQMVTRLFPQEVAHSGQINGSHALTIKVVQVKDGNGNGNTG